MTESTSTTATPGPPEARGFGSERRHKRTRRESITSFLVSLAFHAAILAVMAMITWVVVRESEPEIVLHLGDGSGGAGSAGGGGGGSGGATEGAPEAGAGNVAQKSAQELASCVEAVPVPMPEPLTDRTAIAAPTPPGPAANSAAIDPALLAFGGGGNTSSLGGAGAGGGIGEGTGAGSGPGAGSGVGGGSGSGTGPDTGSGVGPGLGGVLDEMRTKGLDVVFVIDASASMLPYIQQSKTRLREIVSVVSSLVSGAKVTDGVTGKSGIRFGIVAFKDYGDEYGIEATRSLPLTTDVAKLQRALDDIAAGGGGDIPEPLNEALKAATNMKMGWSRQRKSVIVMVTDAPCHSLTREMAMQEARSFAKQIGGQVNVIDVGGVVRTAGTTQAAQATQARTGVLADLQGIAREGNGSAFLLDDEEAFWRHLIVSIFGQRFEQDIQQIIDTYVKHPPK
ncbi:MAG TPA: vWA domain-containing protein [Tepidisphaeraceae bacterium]|nr:vWA domain-containing protein [Tepidisphaeraceae bacterium]